MFILGRLAGHSWPFQMPSSRSAIPLRAAVSLAGDLLFISVLGMGLAGAAWTTALAQVGRPEGPQHSGCAYCLGRTRSLQLQAPLPVAGTIDAASRQSVLLLACCCTAARLQYLGMAMLLRALGKSRVPPRLQLPRWPELRAFLDSFGILSVFYFCKTASYLLLQSTAARLPPLLLAAHQPLFSLWSLASFTATPLEHAALSFLPGGRALHAPGGAPGEKALPLLSRSSPPHSLQVAPPTRQVGAHHHPCSLGVGPPEKPPNSPCLPRHGRPTLMQLPQAVETGTRPPI